MRDSLAIIIALLVGLWVFGVVWFGLPLLGRLTRTLLGMFVKK